MVSGPDQELATLDADTGFLTRFSFTTDRGGEPGRAPIYAMLEDRDGNMWFGSGSLGLLRFNRQHRRFVC